MSLSLCAHAYTHTFRSLPRPLSLCVSRALTHTRSFSFSCLQRRMRTGENAEAEESRRGNSGMTRLEHKIDIRPTAEIHEISSNSRGISAASDREPLIAAHKDNRAGVPFACQQCSSGRNAAADTPASTRCIFVPFRCVSIGYRWMINLGALCLYGLFIMPGVLQVAWRYFSDKRVHRNIPYGQDPRNKLDIYLPNNLETQRPVVAFVSGGAWIIGYKAWGSILAFQLMEEDVIVVCIDYRNFPQGTISDMVEDVSQGISFICKNIADYGGDPDRLYLIGQSAGAHLGACTLLSQVRKECDATMVDSSSIQTPGVTEASLPWRASQFKAYIGISGGYDLYKLANHFYDKGVTRTLFLRIMEGEESLALYSPELCVQNLVLNAGTLIPPIYLLHGTDDRSIPCNHSTSFVEALTSAGVQATARLYEGKSHTDLFIQDPMRGGRDVLLEDILVVLNVGEGKDGGTRLHKRMVPDCLLWLAHRISPF